MKQLSLTSQKRVHVAIMRKSWELTSKILTGEKTIETRWYQSRHKPWDQVNQGDVIYFKDSGEPVKIMATIRKTLRFEDLNPKKVKAILKRFAKPGGLGVEPQDLGKYYQRFRDKKYCLVIFLKDIKKVKPFEIDKSGFGTMTAWLIVDDISRIKKPRNPSGKKA